MFKENPLYKFSTIILSCLLLIIAKANGQGFSTNASNWPIPQGGLIDGTITKGYYLTGYSTAASYSLSSQNWSVVDMNGDGLTDLVVTSENLTANISTVFSPTSNPYWKVYFNTGTGYSTTATNWSIPTGGLKNGSNNLGFYLTGFLTAASYSVNSQNWNLMDMNGDGKPDLVVTSENFATNVTTVYSTTSNPYWKVYLNTGAGFSTSATNWPIPMGGIIDGSTNKGFYITAFNTAASYSLNSQNWNLLDMNGDAKPDLVVTSENLTANHAAIFSPQSNPYWKVYLNTGSGFSITPTNWQVPTGGIASGASNEGIYITAFSTAGSYPLNSQNWDLRDINGDNKPDLLVTSENLIANTTTVFSPSSNPYWKVYINNGSGFSNSTINWTLPQGGLLDGTNVMGFYLTGHYTAASYDVNSQNWNLMDMNGDGLSDLVVTSEKFPTNVTAVYNQSTNPYWKVYFNNGTGFSTASSNWSLPNGGLINGANNIGFYIPGYGTAASYSLNSQNWNVMDINGDGKLDLIVTSENFATNTTTVYSPTSNPYWKVYLNNTTTSGILETNNLTNEPLIYPSPFTNHLSIELNNNDYLKVELFNSIGQKVLQQNLLNSTTINTNALSKGIYFYVISNAIGNITTGKIIKH